MSITTMKKKHQLHSFAENPVWKSDSFTENVEIFKHDFCERVPCDVQRMPVWCAMLEHEDQMVPLYLVEEPGKSLKPNCAQCTQSGWSHHFVSKRKYHFIIPNDNEWNKPNEDGVLEVQSHILHGLIHCNGFGHLLCINGVEGGSSFICGREAMDLWDRICTALHTMKMSVVDLSKKKQMALRVMYPLWEEGGSTWFGQWGYKFERGTSGIKKETYDYNIELVRNYKMSKLTEDSPALKHMLLQYRASTDTTLETINDVLCFLMRVRDREDVPPPNSTKPTNFADNDWDVKWAPQKVLQAADAIVEVLEDNRKRGGIGLSKTETRNAVLERGKVKGYALINFVWSKLDGYAVGKYVVRRVKKVNTLEDVPPRVTENVSKVYDDMLLLYKVMIHTKIKGLKFGLQVLKDCKVFVKEWVYADNLRIDCGLGSVRGDGDLGELVFYMECMCGATEPDGGKLVMCGECMVWQHKRCNGIGDSEVPIRFICSDCM